MPVSVFARTRAKFDKSFDLPRERLSRDHGGLLARVPLRLPPERLFGKVRLRQFCTGPRLSPRMQACRQGRVPHCTSFPYLHVMPLRSAATRFPPSSSYSSLSTRHASSPGRRGTGGTREGALPSHFEGVNCPTHQHVACVQTPEYPDVHPCQSCLHTLFQFASVPSKFGMPMVFFVSRMPPASAATLQGLGARFPPTTGSRIVAHVREQQRKTSQAALPATLQQQFFTGSTTEKFRCSRTNARDSPTLEVRREKMRTEIREGTGRNRQVFCCCDSRWWWDDGRDGPQDGIMCVRQS